MAASVIVVAAGSGTRLGSELPKAFVQLARRTLLAYSFSVIRDVAEIDEAIVAVPHGMERAARSEAERAELKIPIKITAGGRERQDSVRIALALTSAEAEIVVVHDAARPFATPAMFRSSIKAAARSGAAIVAVPVADTLKRVDNGRIVATLARAGLWQSQTPQAFRRKNLIEAHERARRERISGTDDAELTERIGLSVEVVEGSPLNFKITTPDDLRIAEAIALSRFPR